MQMSNTQTKFGIITILFHWVMAVLMIGLLALGLIMVNIPISLLKLKLYGWHKEYGMLVLFLVALRMVWRFINMTPLLNELPRWERISARLVHCLFYLFMIAMPITGWLITSAAGLPMSFFGMLVLPDLVSPNEETMKLFASMHKWLGYGLIALIVLHTSAALKHHFINKDDILRRMF